MVNRLHYNDDILNRLLVSTSEPGDQVVADHVEQCETCQTQLETLSQCGLAFNEVTELLQPSELDANNVERPTRLDFLQPSDHPTSLGRFGRYEILEVLGRGGMGIVMRGFDPALNRHSAIQVLTPELATSAAARQRFSREARNAAAVVHRHVVPIQTVDEQDGLPYLVMPVIEGRSVDDRVLQGGPLELREVVRIAAQVAEGLAAAHDQGLVHRDIKPANILLDRGVDRVQISDFGLARAADDASMTRSGVIAGTPQYMSPEQARGEVIDHRSDLFSLGSLIYFLLTGHSPFRAETTMGVLHRIVNDEPKPLRSINPDIPEWLEQIVVHLLQKDANERPDSASELSQLMNRWLAHLNAPQSNPAPKTASSGRAGKRNTRRGWFVLTMCGFVLAAFALIPVMENGKGTLRIRTNHKLDVPVVIKQGDDIVESLTVTSNGTSTRLAAGRYRLEFAEPVSNFRIEGDQVSLHRGEDWIAKIVYVAPREDLQAVPVDSPEKIAEDRLMEEVIAEKFGLRNSAPKSDLQLTIANANRRAARQLVLSGQPPLTESELKTMIRFHIMQGDLRESVEIDLKRCLKTNQLPDRWKLAIGTSKTAVDGGETVSWTITLIPDGGRPHVDIRRVAITPPDVFREPQVEAGGKAGQPLVDSIQNFNKTFIRLAGSNAPPITQNEVLAAITLWLSKNAAEVQQRTIDRVTRILQTHVLPEGLSIEFLRYNNIGGNQDSQVISVLLLVPNPTGSGKPTFIPIRDQTVLPVD